MKTMVSKIVLAICITSLLGGCTWIQRHFAPKFTEEGVHTGALQMSEDQCLSCHREGREGAPKAPEKMLNRKNCVRCHLK
jgi:uncharacterized protein YceK